MAITENQKSFCSNMETTCCTDEEFETLKKETKDRAQDMNEFTELAQATVNVMSKASDEVLVEAFENLDQKNFSFDLEHLKSKIEELRTDSSGFKLRMEAAISFNSKTFDGYICGVCDGEHHQNVKEALSLNKFECFDLLREKDFYQFGAFTQDMLILNQLAFVLNSIYGASASFQDDQIKGMGLLETLGVDCLSPEVAHDDPTFCLKKCEQFATKNLAPLQEYFSAMATAFVFIQDFCTDKNLYNQFKNPQENENKNEDGQNKKVSTDLNDKSENAEDQNKLDTANQALLNEIKKIKPDSDSVLVSKDSEFSLEKMDVVYGNDGWSNIKYGFYKLNEVPLEENDEDLLRNTSSLDILGIGIVLSFVLL